MSTASKVIVVGSDLRTVAALRFAFSRAGWDVGDATQPTEVGAIANDVFASLALLVIQSDDPSHARLLISQAAARRSTLQQSPSVLFIGSGLSAVDAWQVGATEALATPVYLRDVTVAAQLMMLSGDTNADGNGRKGGQLGDRLGAYQLIRALGRMRRSGVVQLSRGLRRGEVRFYRGEVTSAHTGDLHGQAALHQLLLWTEGRFEYRLEDVVRRRQIPLSPDEIFADAEQFLIGVRDAAGGLSPPMVFASDATVQKQHSEKLPNEVLGVLRLFDGRRAMVDVLQDSPYRMFETLRVARKAVDAGLLKSVPPVAPTIPGATANGRGARYVASSENEIDTWLWSAEWTGGAVAATSADGGASEPTSSTATTVNGGSNSKKNKKKKGVSTSKGIAVVVTQPAANVKPAGIEWGELIPRSTAAELDGLSGVVPASQTSGEIVAGRPGRNSSSAYAALADAPATRKAPREALESLTDADTRERMFSVIVGEVEPAAPPATARPKISDEPPVMMSGELGGVEGRTARKSQSLLVPVNEGMASGGVVGEIVSSASQSAQHAVPVGSTSPSVLVNDLAAIHAAAANAVAGTAETPPSGVPIIRDEETRRERQPVAHPPARNARSTEAETMIGSISTGAASLVASVTSSSIAEAVAHAIAAPTSVLGSEPQREASIVIAPPRNARSTAAEEMVSQTRHSVIAAAAAATNAFSDEEEAFFRKGTEAQQAVVHVAPADTFSDLDEGYQPAKLWDRFRGRPTTRR